jgi:hypothetical protein
VQDFGVTVDSKLKYLWDTECGAETEPGTVWRQVGDGARELMARGPVSNGAAQVDRFAGMLPTVFHSGPLLAECVN